MTEKQLTILAIIITITGLLMLYYTLPQQKDEQTITITGRIISIEQKEKMSILKVDLKTPLKVISFKKTNSQKNSTAKITGKLKEYRGKIELIADSIQND